MHDHASNVTPTPHINMASDLGTLACDLDHYKNRLPFPLRAQAASLVLDMHRVAKELAGEKVGELYAPDEEELHL